MRHKKHDEMLEKLNKEAESAVSFSDTMKKSEEEPRFLGIDFGETPYTTCAICDDYIWENEVDRGEAFFEADDPRPPHHNRCLPEFIKTGKLLPHRMGYYIDPEKSFSDEYGITPSGLKSIREEAAREGRPIKTMTWDEVSTFLIERAASLGMLSGEETANMKLFSVLNGRREVPVFACRHSLRPNMFFCDSYVDEPVKVLSAREMSFIHDAEKENSPLEFVVLAPCKNWIDSDKIDIEQKDVFDVGMIASLQMLKDAKTGEDMVRMIAFERVKIFWKDESSFVATLKYLPEIQDLDYTLPEVKEKIETIALMAKSLGEEIFPPRALSFWKATQAIIKNGKFGSLLDSFAFFAGTDSVWEADLFPYRYAVLKADSLSERLDKTLEFASLFYERVKKLKESAEKRVKSQADEQNKMMLRIQREQINKQLGEDNPEIAEWEAKFSQLKSAGLLPPAAIKEVEKQLGKIRRYKLDDSPYGKIAEWLGDVFFALPWDKRTEDVLDLGRAKKILEEDHFGLQPVKDRILSYLAVAKKQEENRRLIEVGKAELLKEHKRRTVLCFVGPPGVAKTSFGLSIARAMGRNFYATSFGGVEDEKEINGFSETYVGSMPGQIIRGIIRAGSKNPVFMIDEIDKMKKIKGNPEAAMLALFDSTLSDGFVDNYLRVPVDLSEVLFIVTANSLQDVMPALVDRMEVVEFPGYTSGEKLEIAKHFLAPKALKYHYISETSFSDEALTLIRDGWTRKEAGVRTYEQQISAVCRKILVEYDSSVPPAVIKPDMIPGFLGPRVSYDEVGFGDSEPGVATGLAYSEVGGSVLYIEVERYISASKYEKLEDQIFATGGVMEVMKESMLVALARVRKLVEKNGNGLFGGKMSLDDFEHSRFHVHLAPMAGKKEGPSATITLFVAIVSAFTGVAVDPKVAMTGELTLRGKMMPVGGLEQKFSAAHREGIEKIIYPYQLSGNVEHIQKGHPELGQISYIPVRTDEEALGHVFNFKKVQS